MDEQKNVSEAGAEQQGEEVIHGESWETETPGSPETGTGGNGASASANQEQPSGEGESSRQNMDDILEELNRLGSAVVRATKAALNSEQVRRIEQDLSQGLSKLVDNIDVSLVRLRESETTQEIKERAETVVEKVKVAKVTDELKAGLTKGLHTVAEEMQKLADELEKKQKTETPAEPTAAETSESQDIPVEAQQGREEGEA
jgi:hypothetical protein